MESSGQDLAVENLYIRHHAALRRFLTRMLRCEETAADVAQAAYLRILRFAPRRAVDNSRAYLFQVAANAARDHLAREATRQRTLDGDTALERYSCAGPDAEATTLARERLNLLAGAVNELPPRCREVFLMSRLDGLRHGEIAERLGISRNMVEKHIIKALRHCRRHVDAA